MSEKPDLADFVRERMAEKNLSTYDVQKASGNQISAATVTKIINRDIRSNGIETLTALASGLGESADTLINIARGLSARPSRFEIYADRFDAHDLSESEWQMLEVHFNDYVKTWQNFQRKRLTPPPMDKPLAQVVARIEPGNVTKADVRRMIDQDDIGEIEKRIKKKA